MKLKKIPHFNSPEEEDEFWQTHSPLDYEHEPVGTADEPRRRFSPVNPRLPGKEPGSLSKRPEE
jgi:hypothetical protein